MQPIPHGHGESRERIYNRPMPITTLGIDADDTLWQNEDHYHLTTKAFVGLLEPWVDEDTINGALLETERRNLTVFGYGAKGFTLSMIETALAVTDHRIDGAHVERIIDLGKQLLSHPVELLDGVASTLPGLAARYRLVLITKGDLFHQESKVAASGLAEQFDHIEIVAEKDEPTYRRVLDRLGVDAGEFCMVGNSVRSDVNPVLEIGGYGIHVPYHVTWELERAPSKHGHPRMAEVSAFAEIPGAVDRLAARQAA